MDTKSARASVLALLLIASVAVGGIGIGSATADTVALEVTVVTQSGNPVGGATLNATWDGGSATETTASNGRTFIDVPDDKEVSIEVSSNNYVRNAPYVIEDPSDVDGSVEIGVYEDALATITVEDTQGNPVANAEVTFVKNGVAVIDGRTDQAGQIESGLIEVGTDEPYELTVSKRGYLRNSTTVEVQGDFRPTVTLEQASVTATLSVTDPYYDPPEPVENVSIQVGSVGTVRTLSNGEATIQVPVNSQPRLTVSKSGYESFSVQLPVAESPTSADLSISRAPNLTVTSSADRVVVGENVELNVTDEYGDPVQDATVTLGGSEVGTTNARGLLTVPIDSPGDQTITVSAKGVSESITVTGFDPDATETPSPTTESTTSGDDDTGSAFGPGFGVLAALGGLLALAALAGRRR